MMRTLGSVALIAFTDGRLRQERLVHSPPRATSVLSVSPPSSAALYVAGREANRRNNARILVGATWHDVIGCISPIKIPRAVLSRSRNGSSPQVV